MGLTLGVAGNDIDAENYGGLKLLTQLAGGGAEGEKRALAAIAGAQALSPATEKVDAAQLAIRFFSQMGANAAQPGSTALGAAAQALPSAADYLAQVNKRNKELERSRGTLAIQLASAIKPPTSTAPVKVMVDGKAVYMSAAEAIKRGLPVYEKPTSSGTPKAFSVTEENLVLLNKLLKTNLQRDLQGNVTLTTDQFILGQDFVGGAIGKPPQGSAFERNFTTVNELGTKLSAYNSDNTLPALTTKELNEYSAKYQKLITGSEYKEIIDGQEVTKYRPGIDLDSTTNLPIPEGLDINKIISQRSQKFDQNQTKAATFGSRMLLNEGILRNVLAEGYELNVKDIAQISAMKRLGLGTIGINSQAQQFHVAAQNWVAAQLREESGAAINPTEYADALEQYFPKVGDSLETRKQKQALREESTRGMINAAQDAFGVVYPNATQYLKYASEGTEYDILNAQGYANELLAKTELGQTLFFKDSLATKTTEALSNMLANPNAENLFTSEMIDMIDAELSKRN